MGVERQSCRGEAHILREIAGMGERSFSRIFRLNFFALFSWGVSTFSVCTSCKYCAKSIIDVFVCVNFFDFFGFYVYVYVYVHVHVCMFLRVCVSVRVCIRLFVCILI